MEENVNAAVTALGATVEMAAFIRDQLIENGYSPATAERTSLEWFLAVSTAGMKEE